MAVLDNTISVDEESNERGGAIQRSADAPLVQSTVVPVVVHTFAAFVEADTASNRAVSDRGGRRKGEKKGGKEKRKAQINPNTQIYSATLFCFVEMRKTRTFGVLWRAI